ncbi:hypothetical protein F5X68DRAFT_246878 [Plectosphaerella plurivora]|uniref:Uncharacterized protein n=1 Tax=Plectosphaerella plurivora TaxID=936078 RepID=A0A9P9A4Z3_9PEZI|nr:hypothetical protein F5X68DRAFT_246878 [Plectosphaerella plurivora]
MKFTSSIISAIFVAGALAQSPLKVEVRYSPTMVEAGTMDLHAVVWQKIFGANGNQQSIVGDDSYNLINQECSEVGARPNLNARVKINGQWGRIPGLGPNDSRQALVQTLARVLKEVSDRASSPVFYSCTGFDLRIPAEDQRRAACLPMPGRQSCNCPGSPKICGARGTIRKVPAMIRANLFRDGVLLPDSLTVEFSSQAPAKDEKCSTLTQVIGAIAGGIPMPGPIISSTIGVICAL